MQQKSFFGIQSEVMEWRVSCLGQKERLNVKAIL